MVSVDKLSHFLIMTQSKITNELYQFQIRWKKTDYIAYFPSFVLLYIHMHFDSML